METNDHTSQTESTAHFPLNHITDTVESVSLGEKMKTHCWVQASASDFNGSLPEPRSGHTAVNIGKSKIVFFGGLVDKKFLNDVIVYDIENNLWFRPECTGSGSDGQVGPSPRAFHVSVSIDCHMFIFGGRLGGNRLGDFWVLDTGINLISGNGQNSPALVIYLLQEILLPPHLLETVKSYGGWDGKKWLSDVYVLDTISLEWTELSVTGTLPPPRCGHSTTMIEKRLLIYGGRGGGGPIMGDLWALKGLIEEENENPGWTQLKLPGQAPSPRCGHTITSGGPKLLLFGGHGTGGWLSRYDIYYNDCVVLDRVSVQWKRLPTSNEPPSARAYHSMNSVGSRYLLFGGFDGKATYGDLWWLVPEDDPIAKRSGTSPSEVNSERTTSVEAKEDEREGSAVSELLKRLEISTLLPDPELIISEIEDKELVQLAYRFVGASTVSNMQAVQALRDHWLESAPQSITLKELSPLLRDYQRLITRCHVGKAGSNLGPVESDFPGKDAFRFYHVKNASQLRLNDIPNLLIEYKELQSSTSIS